MGRYGERVQLQRRSIGCNRSLHQLSYEHAAVALHPARTISRARRTQHHGSRRIRHLSIFIFIRYIFFIFIHRANRRRGNVEFTGRRARKLADPDRVERLQRLRLQLTRRSSDRRDGGAPPLRSSATTLALGRRAVLRRRGLRRAALLLVLSGLVV